MVKLLNQIDLQTKRGMFMVRINKAIQHRMLILVFSLFIWIGMFNISEHNSPLRAEESVISVLELSNSQALFHNKPVHIKGRVVDTRIAPRGLTEGEYLIEDNTGRIPVRTAKLPAPNEVLDVWGQFLQDKDEPHLMHIHENRRCCPAFGVNADTLDKSESEGEEKKLELTPTVMAGAGLILLSILGLGVFFLMRHQAAKKEAETAAQQRREAEQKKRLNLMQNSAQNSPLSQKTIVNPGAQKPGSSPGTQTMVGVAVASVQVIEGVDKDKTYTVLSPRTKIGKHSGPGGILNGSADQLLSKEHAEILASPDGHCTISDRNSSNGTRINGQPVTQAILNDGDTIELGASKLRFKKKSTDIPPNTRQNQRTHDAPTVIKNLHEQATVIRNVPVLKVSTGPDQGKHIQILKPETSVGRGADNDFVLSDPELSRKQFIIKKEVEMIQCIPISEHVATTLNGSEIQAAQALKDGDSISTGSTEFIFRNT